MILVVNVMCVTSGESQSVSLFGNWYSQPLSENSESSCTKFFSDLDVVSDSLPVGKRIVGEALQQKSCRRVPLFQISQCYHGGA